jgi:ubiquinone/menaquinone biosynthesis C-methylase UbiE
LDSIVPSRPKGVLGLDYHTKRKTRQAHKYRLKRRTLEVIRATRKYWRKATCSVLDVGTADGLMLEAVVDELDISLAVGIDYSFELLAAGGTHLRLAQADTHHLPFAAQAFDIVVATAVIEHVLDPSRAIDEIRRVLRDDGICILTTPDPLFERLATAIGHLSDESHNQTFNLRQLRRLFLDRGLQVLEAEKFMVSPVGFPLGMAFEKAMKAIGLSALLLNQLVVARRC